MTVRRALSGIGVVLIWHWDGRRGRRCGIGARCREEKFCQEPEFVSAPIWAPIIFPQAIGELFSLDICH